MMRWVQRQARSVLESSSVPNIKVVLKEHSLRAGYSKAPLSVSVNEAYPPCNAFQERLWCLFVCYNHGIYARETSSQQFHSYHHVHGEDLAFLHCRALAQGAVCSKTALQVLQPGIISFPPTCWGKKNQKSKIPHISSKWPKRSQMVRSEQW